MKKYLIKLAASLVLMGGFMAPAHAVPVTINMTADNIINGGGLCFDASCQGGTAWGDLGVGLLSNGFNWRQFDSRTIELGAGTYSFTWRAKNAGGVSNGNPAALLAEILWDGGSNYSSASWEVFNINSGVFIENATEYGFNGGANIWANVNGGPVVGISTNANWIYTANNFASADSSAWIRTSITIIAVPEPAMLGLFGLGLVGLALIRRRRTI